MKGGGAIPVSKQGNFWWFFGKGLAENKKTGFSSSYKPKNINLPVENLAWPPFFRLSWENIDFIMGKNMKILKSYFWPEKYINVCPKYTKWCRIATFAVVCFLRKVDFFNIFHEIIMISDLWDCNDAHLPAPRVGFTVPLIIRCWYYDTMILWT